MEENEMLENTENAAESEQNSQNEYQIYLDKINQLKKTTVPKEKYDKILSERDNLVNQMMVGNTIEQPEIVEENKRSVSDLRKALASGDLTNKEFIETSLELRERILETTGEDIFVAKSKQYAPTKESYDASEQFTEVMKESLEDCDGDSEAFIGEYMRRTNDVQLPIRRR